MLKYVNTDVVFQEIPDEVTLAINLSMCPCRCPGCHSKYLWGNSGTELTEAIIDGFIEEYGSDITCISFMGGDIHPDEVSQLAAYIHRAYPAMKTAWYSGRTVISSLIDRANFNYIKIGPYIAHLGPLNNRNTNQRMYRVSPDATTLEDITSRFWKK